MTSTYMDDEDEPLIRPFFLTKGRTDAKLPVEAMIVSVVGAAVKVRSHSSEYRAIIDLCTEEARAVAEVAGRLGLPLGVARVLVSDLADEGLVDLAGDQPVEADTSLLDRIITGLERL